MLQISQSLSSTQQCRAGMTDFLNLMPVAPVLRATGIIFEQVAIGWVDPSGQCLNLCTDDPSN